MSLIETVRKTIRDHDLISKGTHIILGLSGGPDSVCLFHVLRRLAPEWDLVIHPVHVNHRLRPGAAERDQVYVEKLCAAAAAETARENGEPFVHPCRTVAVDVEAMARKLGLTSEEAGRKARYDAFVQTAREVSGEPRFVQAAREISSEPRFVQAAREVSGEPRFVQTPLEISGEVPFAIAVAQNANDQAETILQRLLRGTGPDGLSGIAYERYEQGIPVIRPLLDVPRREIEAYCGEHDLRPVTDHTNTEPIYTRNRIRLELLPLLQEYNPNIISGLARLGRIAAEDRAYLQQQVEEAFQRLRKPDSQTARIILEREGLSALPAPIRHRLIVRAFGEIGLLQDITEERLQAADAIIHKKQGPKTVQFPHGHSLTVKKGQVIFT